VKQQTVSIKFTHRPKICEVTCCTDSHEIWQSGGGCGSAWPHEISRQLVHRGGNAAPKWQKFPLFGKESPHRGEPFDRFLYLLGLLYAKVSCISILHLSWFALQVTELLLRNHASVIYQEFFYAPCRKNYALDRKMIGPFLMVSTSSITM